MKLAQNLRGGAGLNSACFHRRDLRFDVESISVINFPKSRGVPSDSDSASVRESPREIQLLESVEIFTACGQLNFASLYRRDRRDEFRVVVRVVCNADVLAVLEPAHDGRC